MGRRVRGSTWMVMLVGAAVACACACSRAPEISNNDGGSSGGRASSSPSRTGSCDRVASTGTCSEYNGAYLAQHEGLLTTSCGKLGGTFVYAECPNTSVVGNCTLSTTEVRKFYGAGSAAFEPDRAKTECEGSFRGVWQDHR